jgi:hypothetical protein
MAKGQNTLQTFGERILTARPRKTREQQRGSILKVNLKNRVL